MIVRLARLACAVLAASTAAAVALVPDAAAPSKQSSNPFLPRSVAADRAALAGQRHVQQLSPDSELASDKLADAFLETLHVMQNAYFEPWLGQWPHAIDWTAAVMGTHVAAALSSLSQGLYAESSRREKENLITTYFSQLLSYYFGQDAFSIRNEAFDDMLWVVLGWLEAVEFIDYHATLFGTGHDDRGDCAQQPPKAAARAAPSNSRNQSWYGNVWVPAFAHRARIFYDIAREGWDTTLCDGGMNWNPRLEPYKNAITNELFIAASASMYLYFPGDANSSPFIRGDGPHDASHLHAALAGYHWLTHSGMMDERGLYADGFHVSGWKNTTNPNTRCDERNNMVYTYNQGVLLTGQIGLWKATHDTTFLHDGHRLVQSVIRATGYDLGRDQPVDDASQLKPGQLPPWRGLGRAGVLEELCDVSGQCSQNSQTFKGIFFHHLTAFCAPLDMAYPARAADTGDAAGPFPASDELLRRTADEHLDACAAYLGWIRHNARAALATRDAEGKFGMWWTAGLLPVNVSSLADMALPSPPSGRDGVDYRTYGVPHDEVWTDVNADTHVPLHGVYDDGRDTAQVPLASTHAERAPVAGPYPADGTKVMKDAAGDPADPNTRGRGRTVETQGGGLAVLRSLWEISQRTMS